MWGDLSRDNNPVKGLLHQGEGVGGGEEARIRSNEGEGSEVVVKSIFCSFCQIMEGRTLDFFLSLRFLLSA